MKPTLTHERLLQVLDYNPTTGLFFWKESPAPRAKVGSIAGSNRSGYRRIGIDNVDYHCHRLAWFYVYRYWPELYIDHINGVRNDNRIENLREASPSDNKRNSFAYKCNRMGGVKGVRPSLKKFRAEIGIKGKVYSLGSYVTIEEAADAYDRAAIEHFGEYALTNKMIRERNLESGRSD